MDQVGLQDPNNLGQAPLSNPKFLESEGDVKPKLIIIITIIIIIIIDFTFQIKSIFFSIVIIFILNLMILMNLIILNLFGLNFYSF